MGVGNEVWGWGGKEGRERKGGGGGFSEEDKMMALM